jgi:hypothetical protein
MDMSSAIQVVQNAARDVAGRPPNSLDEQLASLGVTPSGILTEFIARVVQAAIQLGYQIDPADFTQITLSNTFQDVADIVSSAISAPRICSLGHPVGAGQSTCAYGHPAN